MLRIIGIVLVVMGLAGVIYGGLHWTRRDKVLDIGPVQVTQDKTESVPISPIAGAVCLVAGAIILASPRH